MEQNKQPKRLFGKLNLVDFIAILLIIAAVVFVGYKLSHRGGGAQTPMVSLNYTVKCEGVDKSLYDNCQEYLPSQLMASGSLYDGQIVSVEKAPFLVLSENGEWIEDPDHIDLYFTVDAKVPDKAVQNTEIAKQEIRVGKTNYILKSQYIEFADGEIVDVTWEYPPTDSME